MRNISSGINFIRVTPSKVDNRNIKGAVDLLKQHLMWDVLIYQHSVKIVPYNGLENIQQLWHDTDFRNWMYKLISHYPEYLFFLVNNESGVDLALACLGGVDDTYTVDEPILKHIRMKPHLKQFLVDSLEALMHDHNIPLKSMHGLYMKILSIPNPITPVANHTKETV